jgi:exosortase
MGANHAHMQNPSSNGILEEFRIEFLACWQGLPNKGFFLTLLVAWLALFQWLGSSTMGYVRTSSLLEWMYNAFSAGGGVLAADEGYGVLIPFVVLGMFWLKRRDLMALELRTWWPGLVLVAFGLALHMLGYLVQQPRLSVIGMFTGIYGLTGLAWGLGWLRASFFPFFLFAFCVPLGSLAGIVTFPLRLLVTRLVELMCHFVLAIEVIRDGTILKDPTGHYQYEVAAACSGIRSLVATLALGVILGFFSFKKWWKRLAMIAAAFPLAVVGNLLRMLAIVIAAEIGGQSAGNEVHEGGPFGIYSLLPYVPAFFGLLWLEHYLREKSPGSPAAKPLEPKAA